MEGRFRVMVIGECGDGKSTLINSMLELHGQEAAKAGLAVGGVTKEISPYTSAKVVQGKQLFIMDTPGVGDRDITAMALLSMVEDYLVSSADPLDALIVTSPVADGRVKLGAQVVQVLVDKGFVGPNKWENIVYVGTKMDMANAELRTFFLSDVKDAFFQNKDGEKQGQVVLTSKDDISQLWPALENLPSSKVEYIKPDVEVMSQALAGRLGISEDTFRDKLNEERAKVEEYARARDEALDQARKAQERIEKLERAKRKMEQDAEEREQKRLKSMAFTPVFRSADKVYSDAGTGSNQDLAVYRPKVESGEFIITYAANSPGAILCAKDAGSEALKEPKFFRCKWTDRGSGGDNDGQLWEAIPPEGYVALSGVAIHRPNSDIHPGTAMAPAQIDPLFRCVHKSLATPTWIDKCAWTDRGSGADTDGSVWTVADSQAFAVSDSHDHPGGEQWKLK